MEYKFQLGSFPYISLAEILNVLQSENIEYNILDLDFRDKILHIEIKNINPEIFMRLLGGTVFIEDLSNDKLYKQNIKEFKKREFGKPAVDSRSGLLPSKLAKMMINLSFTKNGVKKIYDPFCGGGTILTESMVMGINALGTDLDEGTVQSAILNARWIQNEYKIKGNPFEIFKSDVREINIEKMRGKNIDAIVTEPYLGAPVNKLIKLRSNNLDNLNRVNVLIEAALKKASGILDIGKRVVIIIPQFKTIKGIYKLPISKQFNKYSFKRVNIFEGLEDIDKSQELLYFRPKAIVLRELFILEKI